MIESGKKTPSFSVVNDQNQPITDKDLLGKWTVLYFYPKDETTGCTAQACSIRDNFSEIKALGVTVYGISPDSIKQHLKFKENHQLPFILLSDPTHEMAEAFEVWVEKSMYGKKYMGIERSTAIINPEGMVVATFSKVKPEDHGIFLAKELKKLMSI